MSDLSINNKEKVGWDIVKLFMAFCIVLIHAGTGSGNAYIDFYSREWLARMAVPLFFFSSGYFLFKRTDQTPLLTDKSSSLVKKYTLRLLSMFVIWTFIYYIPTLIEWLKVPPTFHELAIRGEYILVRGDPNNHLWYLSALCASTFLIYILNKRISIKKVFIISLIIYISGLFWFTHYYLIKGFVNSNAAASAIITFLNRYIGSPRNGLGFGFVFVSMGALVANSNENSIFVRNKKLNIVLAIISAAASFAEVYAVSKFSGNGYGSYTALQLSLLPLVYFLQNIINSIELKPRPIYRTFRKISTFIYLLHPMIISFFRSNAKSLTFKLNSIPFAFLLSVYIVSFIISWIIVKLEEEYNIKFLKFLH